MKIYKSIAGTAVILQSQALLWTDGRYFTQATQELSADWTLMKSGTPGTLEIPAWLVAHLAENSVVGVDSSLISAKSAQELIKTLAAKKITLVAVEQNPVDLVWNRQTEPPRVLPPSQAIRVHQASQIGEQQLVGPGQSSTVKLENIRAKLRDLHVDAFIVTMLDEIAWLFNIRGSDIAFNPVVISYALVTGDKTTLFVSPGKVTEEVVAHLSGVEILPYEEVETALRQLASEGKRILADVSQINWRLHAAIGEAAAVAGNSPITLAKSIKNETELEGIRQSHIRDGVALTAFFNWLEDAVRKEPGKWTEYTIAEQLELFRGKMHGHCGPSFATIAGYGPNGAIIHYKPSKQTSAPVGVDSLLLLDSGAQYLDGTTDVTRMMHFGEPTQRMKDCYTLVLRGHIALARAVFQKEQLVCD